MRAKSEENFLAAESLETNFINAAVSRFYYSIYQLMLWHFKKEDIDLYQYRFYYDDEKGELRERPTHETIEVAIRDNLGEKEGDKFKILKNLRIKADYREPSINSAEKECCKKHAAYFRDKYSK